MHRIHGDQPILDADTAALVASEFEYEVENIVAYLKAQAEAGAQALTRGPFEKGLLVKCRIENDIRIAGSARQPSGRRSVRQQRSPPCPGSTVFGPRSHW